LRAQRTPDGRRTDAYARAMMQLVCDFLQARLRMLGHDIVQDCDCSCFKAGGLPPTWTASSELSSERFAAIACSFHTSIACHSYVIDLVCILLS
jgi:hypothetical protein